MRRTWLWQHRLPYLFPALPFLYAWMLLALFCLYLSVAQGPLRSALRRAGVLYFWSTALHAAALPIASASFLRHLFRPHPSFQRTPKNGERQRLGRGSVICMLVLGVIAVTAAVILRSPFTPVLLGQGVAYLSFPLYGKLSEASLPGEVARLAIFAPGVLMLLGLVTVWQAIGFSLPLL
jgi:hypothetical protein